MINTYVEKSVQLVRCSSFRNDLLQNPYFKLRHDSLHFQNIKVELLKKEKDEENSMKGQTQDAKQEVEVTENRLNNVTKVNDDEMAQYKEKIYNLSQVTYQLFVLEQIMNSSKGPAFWRNHKIV